MDALIFLLLTAFVWIVLSGISRIEWFSVSNPRIGLGTLFYHTTRLNDIISKIGGRGKNIWKLIWDIGVISGLGILFTGLIVFSINIVSFFLPKSSDVAPIPVTPVIPGVTVSFGVLPYVIVAIMIGAVVHEFAHGIAAINEKVSLKSTGIFIFIFFFGAFVEPEEKDIEEASRRSKMRIMAAGGLANMTVFILILLLVAPIGFPFFHSLFYNPDSNGVLVVDTSPGTPARLEGIRAGYVIIGIQGDLYGSERYWSLKSASEFSYFVKTTVYINQTLTFHFSGNIDPITLRTANKSDFTGSNLDNNTGYVGIYTQNYHEPKFLSNLLFIRLLPYWILNTMSFTAGLNLMLALMNLLPVPFLDGDKLLAFFLGENNKALHSKIKYFALFVLLLNLALSFIFVGWQPI